jgi:hypothetical protein
MLLDTNKEVGIDKIKYHMLQSMSCFLSLKMLPNGGTCYNLKVLQL